MPIGDHADAPAAALDSDARSIASSDVFSERSCPRLSDRPSSRFTLGSELDSVIYEHERDPLPLSLLSSSSSSSLPIPSRQPARSSTLTASLHSLHSLHSNRSSTNTLGSTAFVSSKRDRLRYSWQSLQGDESTRPRIHVVRIVSEIATASAALPGGEILGFSISPRGRRIACYNSARLFILQTAALPVNISQELALKRRPLAVEINDDGTVLAILSDHHTVHVYNPSGNQSRPLKSCKTDFACFTIALSPTGALLAAGYQDGVEVFSLAPTALSTHRRAMGSPRMDRLTFSSDSGTLLGTTTRRDAAATILVSVPVFPASPDGIATHDELKEAWCTGMLEPQIVDGSSHAILLRGSDSLSTENLFAWNSVQDTFGLMGIDDLQYGRVDFPLTVDPPLSSVGGLGAAVQSLPTIDEHSSTVGMIVNDRTIRLYIVPSEHNPDADSDPVSGGKLEAHSIDHELDEEFGNPFTEVRWVHSHADLPAPRLATSNVQGRLLVISPGSAAPLGHDQESTQDREGGRIILFDFDPQYAGQPGQTYTFMLGKAPPMLLQEEELDVDEEIALVRRRTIRQTQANGLVSRSPSLGRSASTLGAKRGGALPARSSPIITPHLGHSPMSASYQPSPIALSTPATGRDGVDSPSPGRGLAVMNEVDEGTAAGDRAHNGNLLPVTPIEDRAHGGSGASFILDYIDAASRPTSARSTEQKPRAGVAYPLATHERSYIYTSGLGPGSTQRPTHLPRALRRTYEKAASSAAMWAVTDENRQPRTPLFDPQGTMLASPTDRPSSLLRIKTDQPQGNPPTLLGNLGAENGPLVEMPDRQPARLSTDQSPGKTPLTSTPYDSSAGDVSGKTSEPRSALAHAVEDLFNHEALARYQSRGMDAVSAAGASASNGSGTSASGDQWSRNRSRSRRRKRLGSRHGLESEAEEARCRVM